MATRRLSVPAEKIMAGRNEDVADDNSGLHSRNETTLQAAAQMLSIRKMTPSMRSLLGNLGTTYCSLREKAFAP